MSSVAGRMRRWLIVLGVSALLVGAGAPARAARATVTITDSAFTPATVHIAVNDDVFWCPDQNNKLTHNVHSPGHWHSNNDIPPGSGCTWLTFSEPGTFDYLCDHVSGMHGTIIVGDGGASPSGATTATTLGHVTTVASAKRVSTTAPHTTTTVKDAVARVTASTLHFSTSSEAPAPTVSTSTTAAAGSGQLAIRSASNGGSSVGNALAIAAVVAMAVGGLGYLGYRRRVG